MRRAMESLDTLESRPLGTDSGAPSCHYSADSLGHLPDGFDSLSTRVLSCYGRVAQSIDVDGEHLNRLAILGLLGRTEDPARRERLFRALQPVWQSVNGDNTPGSPYRVLLRLWSQRYAGQTSPIEEKAPSFGIPTEAMEGYLEAVLDAWRAGTPDSMIEPWDFYYQAGAASRLLSSRIPTIADIQRVNDTYYHSLGADPKALNIHYDLEARPNKYPVAYTDFGARPYLQGPKWNTGEPWVFTSYLGGGLDNLAELLHETGHAVHIAAVRTRPAFADWPDNDTFTEALADFPALEVYEPSWQQRFLGDSVPLPVSLKAKYASIVFDVAWGLFEIRVHRDSLADPNQIWTDLTSRYFRVRPHPELSWWAMRGQLIDGPGYLINYAIGALIVADMRERQAQIYGSFSAADSAWYAWASNRIYRFGLERTSLSVLEEFLGRPLSPEAILVDMRRMGDGRRETGDGN